MTTEQDFEFLLQSGVSIVCSGSSIGLFQAYYIPSRQSQVHLRSTHSFICHPPAVYLGYSDRIKFFIHLSEKFFGLFKRTATYQLPRSIIKIQNLVHRLLVCHGNPEIVVLLLKRSEDTIILFW